MEKKYVIKFICVLIFLGSKNLYSQTLFETAEGDGVISFSKEKTSQVRLNLASTGFTYGYYYVKGGTADPRRLLLSGEVKAKPNDDGIATLVKTGKLQPGLELNGSVGLRINDDLFNNRWSVLDIRVKPKYKLNGYSLYDSNRISSGLDPFYKISKSTFGISLNLNFGVALGKTNLFLGSQIEASSGNNSNDLDEGTLQTISRDPSNSNRQLFSEVESIKFGSIEKKNTIPFKIDMVFDPNIKINNSAATNIKLGFFAYYRTDLKEAKHRNGLGFCFIDSQNPSKIYTSFGYELPTYGNAVKSENRKKDKGVIFISIGLTIL